MSHISSASTSSAILRNSAVSTVRGYAEPPQTISFGRCSFAICEHLVVVDHVGPARDAVGGDRVEPAREVDLEPVREVAAVVEPQAEDRVAGLQQREVRGHVRLRARVRLDVRVLGAEELLRAVDRELLDLVDDLAAAVVAAAGIALGVLVRRHGADRLEHARPGEVLGCDQLDLARCRSSSRPSRTAISGSTSARPAVRSWSSVSWATAMPFLLEPAGRLDARAPSRRPGARRRPETAPSRSTTGSAPVKSITVDGVPGSSPPSTTRRGCLRISSGTSSSVRGSGSPGQVRARRDDRAEPRQHVAARPRRARERARRSCRGSRPSASGSGARGSAARA